MCFKNEESQLYVYAFKYCLGNSGVNPESFTTLCGKYIKDLCTEDLVIMSQEITQRDKDVLIQGNKTNLLGNATTVLNWRRFQKRVQTEIRKRGNILYARKEELPVCVS